MAFNNAKATGIGTTTVNVYTVPTGLTGTIIGCAVANTYTSDIIVSVQLGTYYIVKNATIPYGSSLVVVGGDQKIVALAGEIIKVTSSTASSCDCIVSVLEQ